MQLYRFHEIKSQQYIIGFERIYTSYCLSFLINSFHEAEASNFIRQLTEEMWLINTKLVGREKQVAVDFEHNNCSCKKLEKYGIPCGHLMLLAFFRGYDI